MAVNLTDGQAHDLTLYAVDWSNIGRSEQIEVTSAATGAVLDTETLSNFYGGVYLQWKLSGSVVITVKTLAGGNAVLSGIFFDPPSASGAAKSDVLNISYPTTDTAGTPQSFTVTALSPSGGTDTHYTGTIHFTSSDPQAVLPGDYMFNTTDAGVHTFIVMLKTVGIQSITATDTTTSSITGTESNITVKPASAYSLTVSGLPNPETVGTAGNFTVTIYDQYGNVATGYTGTVKFASSDPKAALPANYKFTSTDAGIHTFAATLNTVGIQSITATDSVTATITGSTSVTVNPSGTSAVFIKQDTNTQGNWIGAYGSQGFNIVGDATSYPSYATVTATGETYQSWVASTTDPRALENAGGSGRTAASWYASTSFTVNVNLTDGQPHDVALYILDWADIAGRSEQIQITSAATKAVLDTQTLTNFSEGVYLQWELSGSVVITVEGLGLRKALLSGIFFDPPSTTGAAKSDLSNISGAHAAEIAGTTRNVTVATDAQSDSLAANDAGIVCVTRSDPQALSPGNISVTAEPLMPITQDINQKDRPVWA